MDQEPGLNFLWSPDEQQPLLRSEAPLAGALLSVQRSNVNNNNSNIHSWRARKTGSSDGTHPGWTSLPSTTAPTEKSSSRSAHPSEVLSILKPHTEVIHVPLNCAAPGEHAQCCTAPSVHLREHKLSYEDERQMSTCKSPEAAGLLEDSFVEPAERCWNMDIISPQVREDIAQAAGFKNEKVFAGAPPALSCSSSHTTLDLSPVSSANPPCTNEDTSSDSAQSTAGADRNTCLPRPCSLDLSSSSSLTGGAPHSDSGLSVSGEKIRRRVKTPYTVKRWRPASWVPPADQYPELLLQATPHCSRIIQSKSSMAMFLQEGGATSKPDGLTSF